jgi:hypothetical protein
VPETEDFDAGEPGVSEPTTSFNLSSLSDGAKSFIKQNSPSGYNPHDASRHVDTSRRYTPQDDDPGCIGTFEWHSEYKPFASKEATDREGKPVEIFENVLYIRIDIRGSALNGVHRPARPEDKARFPFAWQEFNKGEKARERGTAIQMLGLDIPIVRGLAAKNVFTVEDMAAVSDNNLSNLGLGARELRKRAQDFLDAKKESPIAEARISEQQAMINAQAEQLQRAMALIERLSEQVGKTEQVAQTAQPEAPKRRGRPPKAPQV